MEEQRPNLSEPPAGLSLVDLVDRHSRLLYAYAYRLSGSAADAEDLVQQTFLSAQQRHAQIRSAETARGWLLAVLRNCYLKGRRRHRPLLAENVGFALDSLASREDRQPDSPGYELEDVQGAIDQIPHKFRVVVLMFYFEGRSYREIATQLQLPLGTVMSRLSRAKEHLRVHLLGAAVSDRET